MITGPSGNPYNIPTGSGNLGINFNFIGPVQPNQQVIATAQAGEGQAQLGITLSGGAEILEGIDFSQGLGSWLDGLLNDPSLTVAVAYAANEKWLGRVYYLREMGDSQLHKVPLRPNRHGITF